MILTIIAILGIIFILGIYLSVSTGDEGGGWLSMVATIIALFMAFFICAEISNNSSDIAALRTYDGVIAIQQNRINQLSVLLNTQLSMKVSNGQLASTDTPYASLINAYTDATKELAAAQSRKAFAAVNIEARKHGIWAFVVTWYGDH